MKYPTQLILITSIFILTACTPPVEPPLPPSDPPPNTPAPPPQTITEPSLVIARDDLALRLEIPPDQISLIDYERVEWPDSGLGCGLPGGLYLTVITPGFRANFSAQGETYTYHTDLRGNVVLCSDEGLPLLPPLPVTPDDIQDGDPWLPVDPPETDDNN